MKKHLLIFIITLLCLQSIAQIKYENGYFINNEGNRINCLIKNSDWRNNPIAFDYKLTPNDEKKTASIDNVKEFGFDGVLKYVRYDVDIEKVVNQIELLNKSKNPIYKKEQLFLKVLLEGKASLFVYNEDMSTFFFKNDTSDIKQLIYKNYRIDNNHTATNFDFRRQLWSSFKSTNISEEEFESLGYNAKELITIFKKLNALSNSETVEFKSKTKKDLLNFNIRTGINYSSLNVGNTENVRRYVDLGNKFTYRIGLEAEFILGSGNNKWTIPIAIDYQSFKENGTSKVSDIVYTDIKMLNSSIGLRYYVFLADHSKLFITGAINVNKFINSKIQYDGYPPLTLSATPNILLGIGYKKNRYHAEFRYELKKDFLRTYGAYYSNFNNLSLTLGYTLFTK